MSARSTRAPGPRSIRRKSATPCCRKCSPTSPRVWKIRQKEPPKFDLISMLAHGEATRDLPSGPQEFMGNLLLLIVGGNDTTRNSISGGLWFLNRFPEEYAKLRADPGLIPKMVPEIIRYQSPVVHMRRTALCDAELNGKRI